MSNELCIPSEALDILNDLNRELAEYLVIGGYAVLYYGFHDRHVNDLDIWINNSIENSEKVFVVLEKHLGDVVHFEVLDLTKPRKKISLSEHHHLDVDILTSVEGVSFDDCYQRKEINEDTINFVSKEDLVIIKEQALEESKERREKELTDLNFLKSNN